MTKIDAVVVAFNSRDHIDACLERLEHLPDLASITVIDNGSDGTGRLAARRGANVVLRPDNPGFGTAQNAGVQTGSAPFLLLVNPDATTEPEAVTAGLRVLEGRADVAAVQGVIRGSAGEVERSSGLLLRSTHLVGRALGLRRLTRSRFSAKLASRTAIGKDHVLRAPTEPTEVEWLAATAPLVRRSAFESVGGFDERFFLYAEDDDLCRRLVAQGWALIALPDEWARHASGASSASYWTREVSYWEGSMTLASLWFPPAAWAASYAAAVARSLAIAAARPRLARPTATRVLLRPMASRHRERQERQAGSTASRRSAPLPKISLLHATHCRPGGPVPVKRTWLEHANHPDLVEYIFSMDANDPESVTATDGHSRVVNAPRQGSVTAVRNWNAAAEIATGDLLMVVADDVYPPPGWDASLRQSIGTLDPQSVDFAVKVADGPGRNMLLRHPVISRAFYRRFGLFSDDYRGLYCDNDLTVRAFWHSVILDGRSLELEHRHPTLRVTDGASASHRRMNTVEEQRFGRRVFVTSWPRRQRTAPILLTRPPTSGRPSEDVLRRVARAKRASATIAYPYAAFTDAAGRLLRRVRRGGWTLERP